MFPQIIGSAEIVNPEQVKTANEAFDVLDSVQNLFSQIAYDALQAEIRVSPTCAIELSIDGLRSVLQPEVRREDGVLWGELSGQLESYLDDETLDFFSMNRAAIHVGEGNTCRFEVRYADELDDEMLEEMEDVDDYLQD